MRPYRPDVATRFRSIDIRLAAFERRCEPDPIRGDIASKMSVNRLFDEGRFGNKLQSWGSLVELLGSDYGGKVMVRYRAPGSPYNRANVWYEDVPQVVEEFVAQGANRELFSFIEMGDYEGEVRVFQGEVSRSERYYELTYSLAPYPVRQAFAVDTRYAHGIEACRLLRHYLNGSDWDWLQELFDHYPDAVIEFSVWNRSVGTLWRKMIVWEVRVF